jgi:hypothetical protein
VDIHQSDQLRERLDRELAPFLNLGKSEDMEDFYQAVEWVRGNCSFTEDGAVMYHGGTPEAIPLHMQVKRGDRFYRLLQDEAERNNKHLNKAALAA